MSYYTLLPIKNMCSMDCFNLQRIAKSDSERVKKFSKFNMFNELF